MPWYIYTLKYISIGNRIDREWREEPKRVTEMDDTYINEVYEVGIA